MGYALPLPNLPRPITYVCVTSESSGPSTRQLLKLDLALTSALSDYMSLHCGVGTQSPTCTSLELDTASGLILPT